MTRERSILLGEPPPQPEEEHDWYEYKELANGGYEKRWRDGPVRYKERRVIRYDDDDPNFRCESLTLQQQSAVVQWQDILDATEVVEDYDDHRAPWDDCDGWEHELITDTSYWPDFNRREMRGYVRSTNNTNGGIIEVDAKKAYLPDWEYFHAAGASKQVARELAAQALRRCIDQLKEWYEDGWLWHGVKCEYRNTEASVWGIDCRDYAEKHVVAEMAGEVAYQLEQEGWLIEGQPESSGLKYGWSREDWRKHYRDNMNKFNVESR